MWRRCWLVLALGGLSGLLSACQAPMHSGSQCVVEPGTIQPDTAFTWRQDPAVQLDDSTGFVSPLMTKALQTAVLDDLQAKGLIFVERDEGDGQAWGELEVALQLRVRRELVSFDNPRSVCADVDCWERIDLAADTRIRTRTVGLLSADIYYLGEPIWHSWVETSLFPKDRQRADEVIADAVPKLLASFPP